MKHIFSFIIFTSFLLTACATSTTPVSNTPTSITTFAPSLTPLPTDPPIMSTLSPTKSFVPTISILLIPTLSAEQETRLAETLQLESCKLPCYLSIIPGKTSWPEAQSILSELGASYVSEYYESGLRGYEYKLKIGIPQSNNNTPVINNESSQLVISQSLIFTLEDSVVQRIQVVIGTINLASRFHDYWARYSPQKIFALLGPPDAIYMGRVYSVNDGSHMAIVYESLGIVIEFHGRREDNNICPSFEMGSSVKRYVYLTNRESTLSLLPENGRVLPTDRDVWLPIDHVLGISVLDFYNQLLSDSSVCFEANVTDP